MKKVILSLIALFTLGQAAMAQTLKTDSILHQSASTTKGVKKDSPKKADASATGYWVTAKSYYNEETYSFDVANGTYRNYQANLTFYGDSVSIDNLFDLSSLGWPQEETYPIKGKYDAAAKTITISTPGYNSSRTVADYTKYASITYLGAPCYAVLFSGDFDTTPDKNGQYSLTTNDELVFDVNDDLSTLTPRSGFGLWIFTQETSYPYGSLDFYQGANTSFTKMTKAANLAVTPSDVNFEGANVTVGANLSQTVSLINKGLEGTNYTATVEGDGLSLAAHRDIGAGTTQDAYVRFTPTKEGQFNGKINIIAANGSTATINVTANVGKAPDYSQILKGGNITFSLGNDDPFVITDTITGYNVAVSTNKGDGSSSTLNANFSVPAGKVGIISWKGQKEGTYGNGIDISLNDSIIFNDAYSHGMDVASFNDDIANSLFVTPGTYTLSFSNQTMNDWNNTGDKTLRAYVYDLKLDLYDQQANNAKLKSDAVDFGDHFFDKLSVRDTATVDLVNLGTEPLSITSIEGDKVFSAVNDDEEVATGQAIPVKLTYEATGTGENTGKVTINTTAGAFVVDCKAKNTAIPVNYQPIVSSGDFSFNTSAAYPFTVDADSAFSSTAYKSGDDAVNSFLEASFEVPEGHKATLSWEATNSSVDFLNFMGDITLTTGTRITIDGGNTLEFAGDNADASSTNYDDSDLTFGPGRHSVRFLYLKKDSKPKFLDHVAIRNLALKLTSDIKGVSSDKASEAVSTEIYTVGGQRLNALQHGINIVKRIYADGTSDTIKIIK